MRTYQKAPCSITTNLSKYGDSRHTLASANLTDFVTYTTRTHTHTHTHTQTQEQKNVPKHREIGGFFSHLAEVVGDHSTSEDHMVDVQ